MSLHIPQIKGEKNFWARCTEQEFNIFCGGEGLSLRRFRSSHLKNKNIESIFAAELGAIYELSNWYNSDF